MDGWDGYIFKKIKKNREFREVYRRGQKYVSAFAILYVVANNREEIRVGITVSKKVGKSVVRNRIKRIFREVVRHKEKELKKGYDLVIVARKKAVKMDFEKAWKDLGYLFSKSKIKSR